MFWKLWAIVRHREIPGNSRTVSQQLHSVYNSTQHTQKTHLSLKGKKFPLSKNPPEDRKNSTWESTVWVTLHEEPWRGEDSGMWPLRVEGPALCFLSRPLRRQQVVRREWLHGRVGLQGHRLIHFCPTPCFRVLSLLYLWVRQRSRAKVKGAGK